MKDSGFNEWVVMNHVPISCNAWYEIDYNNDVQRIYGYHQVD